LVTHRYVVAAPDAGTRLDQFLASRGLPFTRSQLKKRIDDGEVSVNGAAVAKPAYKLRAGDQVVLDEPPPTVVTLEAENIPIRVVFEDRHLIAIDKPSGLVVHPAAGHKSGTLVNALLHHCKDLSGIGGELRPGIVHRLDRDTTGVMVATKNDAAHTGMGALFKKKDLLRLYRAIVSPPPKDDAGTIRTLYNRHPVDRKRFSSKVTEGRSAVTHWRVLERFGAHAALVECRLETGRTHQIRVHMADSGHPVLGDKMYGKTPRDPRVAKLATALNRQALHAMILCFVHPITGEKVDLSSPIPPDMQTVIDALRALS
jgi:23S rRNA pseudouridine1911/1915/1917 synthase